MSRYSGPCALSPAAKDDLVQATPHRRTQPRNAKGGPCRAENEPQPRVAHGRYFQSGTVDQSIALLPDFPRSYRKHGLLAFRRLLGESDWSEAAAFSPSLCASPSLGNYSTLAAF